jgi:hypothetical protein
MSDDWLRQLNKRLDKQLASYPRWWQHPAVIVPIVAVLVGGFALYLGYWAASIPPRPIIVHVELPQPLVIKVVP